MCVRLFISFSHFHQRLEPIRKIKIKLNWYEMSGLQYLRIDHSDICDIKLFLWSIVSQCERVWEHYRSYNNFLIRLLHRSVSLIQLFSFILRQRNLFLWSSLVYFTTLVSSNSMHFWVDLRLHLLEQDWSSSE